ncbi:hypothetical protein NLX85_18005 [Micromonospora sp. A3M-1-15]|uniref:hypothetical protein n=1 Tax=Micromonospora sp. A3M-1-15 TaxID=2962035 RepID=UPI0020B89E2B|nr:hypothetical protein [Micromonospora sp. A3M-1-15]MCP3785262.1 hypothetical protein [Micromonospora sp. A3M-1-15]
MVYGVTGRQIHLSLPLPELRALARSINEQPSREICDAIVAAAAAMVRRSQSGPVDPYWLHAEVQQNHPSVSIGQVAWVLLAWLQVPR